MSMVVDLPAPFGPSRATVSPGAIDEVDAAHGVDRAERLREAAQLESDAAPVGGRRLGGWSHASMLHLPGPDR